MHDAQTMTRRAVTEGRQYAAGTLRAWIIGPGIYGDLRLFAADLTVTLAAGNSAGDHLFYRNLRRVATLLAERPVWRSTAGLRRAITRALNPAEGAAVIAIDKSNSYATIEGSPAHKRCVEADMPWVAVAPAAVVAAAQHLEPRFDPR